ncbi:MAG: VWA domain-containing protein [Acidilobaceae archaeon]
MTQKRSVIAGVGVLDELRIYRGERIIRIVLEIKRALRGDPLSREEPESNRKLLRPELATDIFYLLNLPIPMIVDYPGVSEEKPDSEYAERYVIIAQLLKNPKLHHIRNYTVADSLVSTVAAASILEKLTSMLSREELEHESTDEERRGCRGSKSYGRELSEKAESGEEAVDNFEEVVDKALDQAMRDAETAKRIKAELFSKLAGTGSILSFEDTAEKILELSRLTDVSKILEKIEGLDIPGARGRKIRVRRGWVEGIEVGSDLERLHYSQLALPTEYFMVAFAESKLLLYSKHEDVSKGPIYVLLDKSGSMVGEKIDWARAVAVALLKRAIGESRAFYARYFDSSVYSLIKVSRNPRASEVVNALASLARVAAGGGTDIMRALLTACNDISKSGRAQGVSDIILISDGEDRINVNIVRNSLTKARARLHTVMIYGSNQDLKEVSYRYMTAQKLEDSDIIRVVDFH